MRVCGYRAIFLCMLFTILGLTGCPAEKPAPPKSAAELSEEEKKQIIELNEQRAQEWGTPKRK